jgi:hypothetical protein
VFIGPAPIGTCAVLRDRVIALEYESDIKLWMLGLYCQHLPSIGRFEEALGFNDDPVRKEEIWRIFRLSCIREFGTLKKIRNV